MTLSPVVKQRASPFSSILLRIIFISTSSSPGGATEGKLEGRGGRRGRWWRAGGSLFDSMIFASFSWHKFFLSNFAKFKIFQVHTLHLIQLVAVAVLLSLVSVIYTLLKMSFCLQESWNLMQKCKIVDFRVRRSIGQEGHARQIMNILKSQLDQNVITIRFLVLLSICQGVSKLQNQLRGVLRCIQVLFSFEAFT